MEFQEERDSIQASQTAELEATRLFVADLEAQLHAVKSRASDLETELACSQQGEVENASRVEELLKQVSILEEQLHNELTVCARAVHFAVS